MAPCLQENAKEVVLQFCMSLVKTRARISCLLIVPALQNGCQHSMICRKDCVCVHNKTKTKQTTKNLKPPPPTKKACIKIAVKLLMLRIKKCSLTLPERRLGSVVISLIAQRKEDVKAEVR